MDEIINRLDHLLWKCHWNELGKMSKKITQKLSRQPAAQTSTGDGRSGDQDHLRNWIQTGLMRTRLIALLVIVALVVSSGDFFSSQWVFKRGFASYAAESRRDQVHDWAVLLGLLYMDVQRMTQVLLNLLSNALRFNQSDSRMTLSAQLLEETAEVAFTVCDERPGIAAEHLPHVLERFYRADVSRQRDTGGTGLGLAIVAEIAHAHGGQVDVESTVGRGTCVQVSRPHRIHAF